ncbi:MAG: hypothetical protein ACREHC_01545 [Candidatus Levyibacteriota bacterium]
MEKEAQIQKGLYIFVSLIVIVGVLVMLSIYLLYYSQQKKQKEVQPIIYKHLKLHIFGETIQMRADDSIFVHDNYLLVVRPFEGESRIYNMQTQKRIASKPQLALDFDGKNLLYNQNGATTYFNNIPLKKHCSAGYIKSSSEILCITPKHTDLLDNELLSLNPKTGAEKVVYASRFTLNTVTVIKNTLYIGGFVLASHQPVVIVNNSYIKLPDRADVIYPRDGHIFIGSFAGGFNSNTESYTLLSQQKQTNQYAVTTQQKGEIVFYGFDKEGLVLRNKITLYPNLSDYLRFYLHVAKALGEEGISLLFKIKYS